MIGWFGSSVSYLGDPCQGDPCAQMNSLHVNSRGVKQAHLIAGHKEIEGDASSLLGLLQKLLLFPANLRQSCWTEINEEKSEAEWVNRWNRDCNDEQSAQC